MNNFCFRRTKQVNEVEYWTCLTCNVKAITSNRVVRGDLKGEHTHPVDTTGNALREIKKNLKEIAQRDNNVPLQRCYNNEMNRLNNGTDEDRTNAALLNGFKEVSSSMQRSRRKLLPPLPTNRADVILPVEYKKTERNEPFMIINDGADDRIIAFSTLENQRALCNADILFGDGTFYACPQHFTQIYTLHAVVSDTMIPLVYAYLPSKTEETYVRFLRLLDNVLATNNLLLHPETVFLDFELAAHNAWRTLRPNISISK